MADVHRFVPSRRLARTHYAIAAVVGTAVVAGIQYLTEGDPDPRAWSERPPSSRR